MIDWKICRPQAGYAVSTHTRTYRCICHNQHGSSVTTMFHTFCARQDDHSLNGPSLKKKKPICYHQVHRSVQKFYNWPVYFVKAKSRESIGRFLVLKDLSRPPALIDSSLISSDNKRATDVMFCSMASTMSEVNSRKGNNAFGRWKLPLAKRSRQACQLFPVRRVELRNLVISSICPQVSLCTSS